ncbi:hypothetical protein F2Q69_00059444 [Brassica cretica]|uniref:Uncharacterized protein n=1 Tax=Brassica cretica TaxID=69181 RepID=A0A8S9RG17_BRACR|nr:hypothetical protein F2Q69_00059444 [Brassica cretica]
MAELVACSIQLGHPPNWNGPELDPARRMAELVACLNQLGHPPNWIGPARRMAELVACSIQIGHPPSWSRGRSSFAIRRAGRCALS